MPLRVCLLENQVIVDDADRNSNCCSDCDRETNKKEPCCIDLEALPDSSVPQPSVELPPVIITDLQISAIPPPVPLEMVHWIDSISGNIRGPDSPAAYRAVLSIWRL